ncbi:Calcium-activated chloride channel regulator 1 [Acipenser ruthenus]|uniref:Calcium-activated chloride channel regulator 1 n=1 Tax=Acipenser ruthenus TaxID=7906 RepID=A0A662YQN5_ACIRT|nr:Calcium-activated chloride channel regulator 1 [Acipenser ruthenus]
MVTRASGVLYNATRKRAFFRDVKILIPRTWGSWTGTQTPTYETYNQVNMFCDSESHNAEAPNDQNRKCDYRSTWDVISESEDFKDNSNKPVYLDLPTPTFTLLQPKDRKGRLTRLRQASVLFLKDIIEEDSKVAIVTFNSKALIKRYLTNISDDDTRNQLIKDLPTTAEGGTNICSGLQMGFQVLEKDGSSEGGEIILLTDGEDSSVGRCFDEFKNKGTKIHSIALGPNAEKDLEKFPQMTGADLTRNDGIYSVFFRPTTKGRHGFKVRVESIKKQSKQEPALASHAMYVRSYFENGALHWNPPKPPVSDNLIPVEDFSRTKSGGAFIVTEVPPAGEDVYPPCKITDFAAAMENDTVMLSWTAPGDDLDEGTALEYELRISGNVQELRDRFHNATKVNTTAIRPLPARSKEEFSFVPEMTNDTVIYLAIRALDETGLASGLSNIEQVTIAKPAVPTTTANIKDDNKNTARNKDLILGIAVASVAGGTCLIIGVIAYAVQKRRSGQFNIGVI